MNRYLLQDEEVREFWLYLFGKSLNDMNVFLTHSKTRNVEVRPRFGPLLGLSSCLLLRFLVDRLHAVQSDWVCLAAHCSIATVACLLCESRRTACALTRLTLLVMCPASVSSDQVAADGVGGQPFEARFPFSFYISSLLQSRTSMIPSTTLPPLRVSA